MPDLPCLHEPNTITTDYLKCEKTLLLNGSALIILIKVRYTITQLYVKINKTDKNKNQLGTTPQHGWVSEEMYNGIFPVALLQQLTF